MQMKDEELLSLPALKMDILDVMGKIRQRMEKPCKIITSCLAALMMLAAFQPAMSEDAKPFVSVEENLRLMDKDRDGMVSVQEVRAALEARHGKGYEQALLADMEASASGRSCSTPFAQNFY